MNYVRSLYKKMTYKHKIFYTILICCFIGSVIFVHNNYSFYKHPIAEVVKTNIERCTKVEDLNNNEDVLYTQHIIAELKNGEEKGMEIHLINEFSQSKAFDNKFEVGNELLVSIDQNS